MKQFAFLILLCSVVVPCLSSSCVELKEIIIRPPEIMSWNDAKYVIDNAASRGILGISIAVKDDETGELFYASTLQNTRPYTDTNPSFNMSLVPGMLSYVRSKHLLAYAWVPMFFDPVLIASVPSAAAVVMDYSSKVLTPSTKFSSPIVSSARNHSLNLIADVNNNMAVDGFRLDYIRFTDDDSSYDDGARSQFQAQYGVDPVSVLYNTEMWDNWCIFRASAITTFLLAARESIPSSQEMGGYLLPFSAVEGGYMQFTSQGNDYSDYTFFTIMPMTYYEDWSERSGWSGWLVDYIRYARTLSGNSDVVSTLSMADKDHFTWESPPTSEKEVQEILGQAMISAVSTGQASGISLFHYFAWDETVWDRLDGAVTYVRNHGYTIGCSGMSCICAMINAVDDDNDDDETGAAVSFCVSPLLVAALLVFS